MLGGKQGRIMAMAATDKHSMYVEDVVDPNGPPAWLHLLSPLQKAWREKQILKGRNPDTYIEGKLKDAGLWPETRRAKNAKRP